jgi:hypothetical protein
MKDNFSDTASIPARPGDDTNDTRRGVITPDGDRGDDDDEDELSKLTQLDEPHSPEQQIVVEKRRYFVPEIIKERNKKRSQTAVALDMLVPRAPEVPRGTKSALTSQTKTNDKHRKRQFATRRP